MHPVLPMVSLSSLGQVSVLVILMKRQPGLLAPLSYMCHFTRFYFYSKNVIWVNIQELKYIMLPGILTNVNCNNTVHYTLIVIDQT